MTLLKQAAAGHFSISSQTTFMSREKRIDRGKSKGLLKDYLVMNNTLWDEIKRKQVIYFWR